MVESILVNERMSSTLDSAMKNRVRELRASHELSQEALGRALGVSRQTINSIENGRYTPSLPLAIEIARHFGTTVEQVFEAEVKERS